MQTAREYLFGKGLAKAPTGRGRFSAAAHEALAEARKAGIQFSDDTKPEPKPKKTVEVKVRGPKPEKVAKPTEKVDPKAVREWAKKNGHEVGERGRIHADIINAYLSATPKEDRAEVSGVRPGEKDLRPSAPRTFPEGTKFRAEFTYKGKDVTHVFNDRTCCYNCKCSLSGCRCGNPKAVTGYTEYPVALTPIYPKG